MSNKKSVKQIMVIINAELTNPPTTMSAFRDLTLSLQIFSNQNVIVECQQEYKDIYYCFLKRNGAFDFVEDIVNFGEESGVRLDVEFNFYPTVVTEKIVPENYSKLVQSLKFWI